MLRIAPTLILLSLVVDANAEDTARFVPGRHLLHTTFDEKDPSWNFNHDVNIRLKGELLTLTVLDDRNQKAREADKTDSKRAQGGFGSPAEDGAAMPLFTAKQKLHGIIDTEEGIRFGATTIQDGKLVSLHFVGGPSLGGATGKVYLLSSTEPVREGTWYLKNSFSRGGAVPGYNGTNPFGP